MLCWSQSLIQSLPCSNRLRLKSIADHCFNLICRFDVDADKVCKMKFKWQGNSLPVNCSVTPPSQKQQSQSQPPTARAMSFDIIAAWKDGKRERDLPMEALSAAEGDLPLEVCRLFAR